MKFWRTPMLVVFVLLIVAGLLALRTWPHTTEGPFDPVSAVVGLAGLAVAVPALIIAARSQRRTEEDLENAAQQLAAMVKEFETRERSQLLGAHDKVIDLKFEFNPAPAHNASGAAREGSLTDVSQYYSRLKPKRLIITGAAGAGKTVLAVELILGLLENRARDQPVHILVSAALLDTNRPSKTALEDWLVHYLSQTYQIQKTIAQRLVSVSMVIPVLDGLDEMGNVETAAYSSRAGQLIRACNAYLDGSQKGALILTCREDQYKVLQSAQEWVMDAACVRLLPLKESEIRSFLVQRATDQGRWDPILNSLGSRGGLLAAAFSTPWRLGIAATVYERRDPTSGEYLENPADLTSQDLDTEDKIRDRLLELFIPAVMSTQDGQYRVPMVYRWLSALAAYLEANNGSVTRPAQVIGGRTLSGTDMVLHELWPLAGPRAARVATCGLMTATVLAIAGWALATAPFSLSFDYFGGIFSGAMLGFIVIQYSWTPWPILSLTRFRIFRSARKRWKLISLIPTAGIVLGGLIGAAAGRPVAGIAVAAVVLIGLAFLGLISFPAFFVLGFVFSSKAAYEGDPREYSAMSAGRILKTDLLVGFFAGLFAGVIFRPNILIGIASGFLTWLIVGLVWWRYVALLVLTRRLGAGMLPWRLGQFMQWCYEVRLLRMSGIGYQFRHRELQEYLYRNRQADRGP